MLDLRRLRLLKEFAERGTITATAAALGYTPSAVSQQLAALEREAGTALIVAGERAFDSCPECRAMPRLVDVGEFVDDHIVQHPLGFLGQEGRDADGAVGRCAGSPAPRRGRTGTSTRSGTVGGCLDAGRRLPFGCQSHGSAP